MDRSQWWFYAAIEDACLPPRPCYFSPTISFSLPPSPFIPLPFFPFSLPLALAHAPSLSFSRFLVLSRTHVHAHTTHRSPTVQFFASLSPYRFRFIASSPLLRSLVLSRPFVTNRATLHEQQKGPLLVKPFSYTSRWFFQPRISISWHIPTRTRCNLTPSILTLIRVSFVSNEEPHLFSLLLSI